MYHGWIETREQTTDRRERIWLAGILGVDWYGRTIDEMIAGADCTCTPRDETCPACVAQAQERYPEIPYGGE